MARIAETGLGLKEKHGKCESLVRETVFADSKFSGFPDPVLHENLTCLGKNLSGPGQIRLFQGGDGIAAVVEQPVPASFVAAVDGGL